jgi:Spy/CpxP family protein refolding chaperone
MMLLLAGTVLGAPLVAQERAHGQRQPTDSGGMMQMHAMQMQAMMPGPMMILQLREPLKLTADQVKRIEAIRDSMQRLHDPHMHAAMQAMHQAEQMLEAPAADLSGYEAKLKEGANHLVLGHLTMTRGWLAAREVLTPEQRNNMEFGMKVMKMMMAERMQSMGGMGAPPK